MEEITSNLETRGLRRWSRALLVLSWLGIAIVVYQLWYSVFGEKFYLALPPEKGLEVLSKEDFLFSQRLVISTILSTPVLCWIYCLFQMVQLSCSFGREEILNLGMVGCLQRFGGGMFVMAMSEASAIPVLSYYLLSLKKIEPVKDLWEYVLAGGAVTSLMAAVLVLIIARIFKIGIRLREDAELTI